LGIEPQILMIVSVLSILALVTAILAIYIQYKGYQSLFFFFKPLTTIIIISLAIYGLLHGTVFASASYPYYIVISLVICLVGDICIMLGDRTFLFGLISFTLAHVLFALAFFNVTGWVFTWWLFLVMAVFAFLMIRFLLPYIKKQSSAEPIDLTLPVIVYATLIALMIWLSLERFYLFRDNSAWLTLFGALLFGASDIALALNKFKGAFHSAELIILGTYFPAIWLFALSI
jgi:uncharacterized membrane protein YhhN